MSNDKNIPEGDYPLIPMNEITDEARKIAKAWYDGISELNDIREKHKLASDIMNYAKKHTVAAIREFSLSTDEGMKELNELKEWKRQAIEVMPDFQAIGQALGIKLGESVHDKILPCILDLNERYGHLNKLVIHMGSEIKELRSRFGQAKNNG